MGSLYLDFLGLEPVTNYREGNFIGQLLERLSGKFRLFVGYIFEFEAYGSRINLLIESDFRPLTEQLIEMQFAGRHSVLVIRLQRSACRLECFAGAVRDLR